MILGAEKKDPIERPTLLANMDKSDLPETAVPIGQGWDGKIKRDEEKHNEKELADKGAVKKSK